MDIANGGRDNRGRFALGSAGGPGRPRGGKGEELAQAAREAVTAEHMHAIMRKAMMMALGGNLGAMKFVAERAVGRAVESRPECVALDLELPRLTSIDSCSAAIDRVNDALVAGAIDIETARVLVDIIGVRVKAIELKDVGRRLSELEEAARQVELGGKSR